MSRRLIILAAVFALMVCLSGCSSAGKKAESSASSTVLEPKTTAATQKDIN